MPCNEKTYAASVIILFFAGFAHAKFILLGAPSSTWTWHLWQWLPLLAGAAAFAAIGWVLRMWVPLRRSLSGFGWFGIIAAPFAAAGVGYVLGYHFI